MRRADGPPVRPFGRVIAAAATISCLIASLGLAGPAAAAPAPQDPRRLIAPDRSELRDPADPAVEASPVVPGALLVTTSEAPSPDLSAALEGDQSGAATPDALADAAGGEAQAAQLAEDVVRVVVEPERAEAVAAELAALPGVVAVEPERTWEYSAQVVPNDPSYGDQWSHQRTGAEAGWDITTGGTRRIAVIDSGIDSRHPELSDRVVARAVVRSVDGRFQVVNTDRRDNDECVSGHGSAVAGVAAAAGNNSRGITGIAWNARIVDVALSTLGNCSPSDAKVIAALGKISTGAYGVVDVVNLSLGGREPSGRCPAALQKAIDGIVRAGAVVVVAAGNDGYLDINVPAACDGVITVGATGPGDSRAGYSSMGRYLDLVAPGGEDHADCRGRSDLCVLTTSRESGYTAISGTSFAAPYVSGVVTLLKSLRPSLTPAQIESVLERTAKHPRGAGAHDHQLGWGLVRVDAALRHLRDGRTIPAPQEHPAVRISRGSSTAPVGQAVAMSQATFRNGAAQHAVLARADDYADALAGASLAYGIGPVLFTPPRGSLAPDTADELARVLPRGATVYLLGGSNALDARLDDQIRKLGLRPKRVYGPTREWTAVAVAREVHAMVERVGQPRSPAVLLAKRSDWPDAVAAGSIGAAFGVPVLLTPRQGLHSATRSYLEGLGRGGDVQTVYVVGGTGVVSDAAARAAGEAAGPGASSAAVRRLSGPTRDQTAIAVAREMKAQLADGGVSPSYAVAVDLDRADGYAHALSASVLSGSMFSVFVPVRGPTAPQRLTGATAAAFCGARTDGLLAGGPDLLPDALGAELVKILDGSSPRC